MRRYPSRLYVGVALGAILALTLASVALAMMAKPSITTFSPMSGSEMTKVTITGKNFTGATVVTFDMVKSKFKVVSATKITTSVPAMAKTGKVSVTTKGGTATSMESFGVTKTKSSM